MIRVGVRARCAAVVLVAAMLGAACGSAPQAPARQYPLSGQILAVDPQKQQITIKHGDIPGLMPAMTMSYPVASPDLLVGRAPGELISATLEVQDAVGRLTSITHTGSAPLPSGSNEAVLASEMLEVGEAVPDVALVDQSNRRRSLAEWKGELTVVTFVYTRCPLPNYCPLMDEHFQTMQARIAADPALRGHVRLVSVTIDPDYDTPAVLAEHAKMRRADPSIWTFLTGDRGTIDRMAGRLGVGIMRDGSPSLTHNLRTILLDRDLRILKIYSGNDWMPDDILKDAASALSRGRNPSTAW